MTSPGLFVMHLELCRAANRKKKQQPLSVSVSAAVVLGVARIRVLPGLTRSSSQGQNPKLCSDLTD